MEQQNKHRRNAADHIMIWFNISGVVPVFPFGSTKPLRFVVIFFQKVADGYGPKTSSIHSSLLDIMGSDAT